MIDINGIEQKWQQRWEKDKVFETEPDKREKFFGTFPYPYINAYTHIGHFFSLMRTEAFCRYKRLKGFNVLYAQGWHATGSPIVNAAKRVADREEKQMKIMRDQGFSDEEIERFRSPEYWVEFFAPQFEQDYRAVGLSIDWRRTFYTTSLNTHYDKFITWQFNRMREKGFVIKGKFPVVWDPKEGCPVGDHDRIQGEGETPQEFTLLKMRLEDETGNPKKESEYIVVATLRPETQFGQTNVWIGPDIEYVKALVSTASSTTSNAAPNAAPIASAGNPSEVWIISRQCADKLKMQDKNIEIIGTVPGKELIGRKCLAALIDRYVPILPSSFCNPDKGTGIVTSVPSDAPDDYMGLFDLQQSEELCSSYGLDHGYISSIEVIPIIDTPELGDTPAVKVCKDLGVKDQNDREKLDEAKRLVYKKGFYEGKMNSNTGRYAGMPVQIAKNQIKGESIALGHADIFYELTGKVVSRTLTECVVKIVDDQWFMDYNNPEWKKLAHECLDGMNLYPEIARTQFNYVIDWLHEWACTREEGLGTKLPWDHKWIIESLSDSTIYMAYYTIAHLIEDVPIDKIDDSVFDYIFWGKGQKPDIIDIDRMRESFEYYYPVDFRNSGKDLIQNHLTFSIFNHVAMFPKDKWPKGFGVNGWLTVDGQKMSKSLGNMILLKDMVEKFTADASRITILNGGEGMDDPNWDSEFARSIGAKLAAFHEFAVSNYRKHERDDIRPIDRWFESELNRIIKETEENMELTQFRSAIQKIYFELTRVLKHYMKRTDETPNSKLIDNAIESMAVMLSVFAPHICEETWEALGKEGYISLAEWPSYDESRIDRNLARNEEYISQIIDDTRSVMRLAAIDRLESMELFQSEPWKYTLYGIVSEALSEGSRDFKSILEKAMSDDSLKMHGQQVAKMLPQLIKKGSLVYPSEEEESAMLADISEVLKREFGVIEVSVSKAEASDVPKAKQASPGKPAMIIK